MDKLIAFFKRKPGLTPEEFQTYWTTTHADLSLAVPGTIRLAMSYALPHEYAQGEPCYDGLAETYLQDMRAAAGSPPAQAAMADHPNYLDPVGREVMVVNEVVQKDGAVTPSMVKLLAFIIRKPGMSVAAFQKHWLEVHGRLIAQVASLRRFVQNVALPSAYEENPPQVDGIAELWFDDLEAMRNLPAAPQYPAINADNTSFTDPPTIRVLTTREVVRFR